MYSKECKDKQHVPECMLMIFTEYTLRLLILIEEEAYPGKLHIQSRKKVCVARISFFIIPLKKWGAADEPHLVMKEKMKYEIVKSVNIIITGDYFGFYVDFVRTEYPGELVLVAEYAGGTDVEDVDEGSQNESSGVRGVVER